MKEKIVGPCGIDCFNCEMYEDNVTKTFQKRISALTNIPAEKIVCKGCVDGNQCLFLHLEGKTCKTLACANEKGVDYCYECDIFPCDYLMPLADRADKFPHNIKLYNLCLIKRIGLEAWKEQAADIRKVYFTKKLTIGDGGKKTTEKKD
ncbi:DUF3795 domain-containing protein [Vallitalea pronyensis]|uniref:DUF3795 domain-containing protein n=1 Tax=Vallitalea pronyensis TaxID=1348613 RepID=A0A8J8SF70_9FIRM|nr:DUF3795 domain-containing protein [Vallitalea pronyensis]QUI21310.1 DUF3795 domain-containing protein [Vallitalea pronyensis]